MVDVQKRLLDHLGIDKLFAVIGGSFGGMQVLQWCVSYPEMVRLAVPIATSAYSSPQQIAFNEVGRRAITSDPDWENGNYYGRTPPARGLSLARMIGHITYLSDESMHQKFGRRLQGKTEFGFDFASLDFQVESYLSYHGDAFVKRFDANSYLYITKAIDYFDLTKNGALSLAEAFNGARAKFLVISISSDWLYPPYQCKEIAEALSANDIDVRHCEIRSNYGHDAFLLESGQMNYTIQNFLSRTSVGDVMIKRRSNHSARLQCGGGGKDYDDRGRNSPAGDQRGRKAGGNCHRLGCVQGRGLEVYSSGRDNDPQCGYLCPGRPNRASCQANE